MANKNRNFKQVKGGVANNGFRPPMRNPKDPDDNVSPEDIKYLDGVPTRMEVANYVNSLLEEEYMPKMVRVINGLSSSAKLGIMIMQAILIEKGIVTGDEIEKLTNEFMEKYAAEQEDKMKKTEEKQEKEDDNKNESSE